MTQNKHKATHDQLRETKLPLLWGVTFTASVVQLVKAWLRLLLFFWHMREHWYTCWQIHTCALLKKSREWRHLCFIINVCEACLCSTFQLWFLTVGCWKCPDLLRLQFFGCPLLLSLPQMTSNGDGIHAGWHGFGRYQTELLPVRVIFVQALDHLGGDAPRPDASQFGDLLCLGAVCVHGPELASSITEQNQEAVGFRFLHFLQKIHTS